jgi:uncharacterized protein YndB with AHSA1/START domain
MQNKETITVTAIIDAPVQKVWKLYTEPQHIVQWNNASPDWHTPTAKNDLKTGGKFVLRMEAKDKSAGFDFTGTYNEVKENELLAYTMEDGRKAQVTFSRQGNQTKITIVFDAETENPADLQRQGWQAILDNFKAYAEKQK